MRLRLLGLIICCTTLVALAFATAAPAATTKVGPLVLSGPRTIQSEGANILSFAFLGAPTPAWDPASAKGDVPHAAGVTELLVTKPVDASTPALLKAVLSGEHYKHAFLSWTTGTATQSLCLEDVYVSSVKPGTNAGTTPVETVALNYLRAGTDQTGTAACSKLGPAPVATVTTALKGATFYARVACLSTHCGGTLSLRLPRSACASPAAIMSPGAACAGKAIALGRIALHNGGVRVLRLSVARGRLRRALTRLTTGTSAGIIAVLRRAGRSGHAVRLVTIAGGAIPKLPQELPAVQSTPVEPGPAPTTPPPAGPVATSLTITTCGAFDAMGRAFAGHVTPAIGGLSIAMTYTPPAQAAISQTVTTDAAGQFSDQVAVMTPGSWTAVASFAGNAAYGASSSASCSFPGG